MVAVRASERVTPTRKWVRANKWNSQSGPISRALSSSGAWKHFPSMTIWCARSLGRTVSLRLASIVLRRWWIINTAWRLKLPDLLASDFFLPPLSPSLLFYALLRAIVGIMLHNVVCVCVAWWSLMIFSISHFTQRATNTITLLIFHWAICLCGSFDGHNGYFFFIKSTLTHGVLLFRFDAMRSFLFWHHELSSTSSHIHGSIGFEKMEFKLHILNKSVVWQIVRYSGKQPYKLH